MKKNLCMLLLALTGLTATAAESNDTILADVDNPRRVIVSESDSYLNISIQGRGGNPNYKFNYTRSTENLAASLSMKEQASRWDFSILTSSRRKSSHFSGKEIHMGGLYFGFVTGTGAPAGVNIDMLSSYEIGTDLLSLSRILANRNHRIRIGFGLDWRNYRMTGRTRFVKTENGDIGTGAYPEGADIKFSRLKIFSLTVPVRYTYYINRKFSVDAAAILCFNTYGSLKTRYKLEGQKHRDFDKSIHQRPVTVDFQLGANYKGVGLYVKYSPASVIKKDYGPDFKSLSTGVKLFF